MKLLRNHGGAVFAMSPYGVVALTIRTQQQVDTLLARLQACATQDEKKRVLAAVTSDVLAFDPVD